MRATCHAGACLKASQPLSVAASDARRGARALEAAESVSCGRARFPLRRRQTLAALVLAAAVRWLAHPRDLTPLIADAQQAVNTRHDRAGKPKSRVASDPTGMHQWQAQHADSSWPSLPQSEGAADRRRPRPSSLWTTTAYIRTTVGRGLSTVNIPCNEAGLGQGEDALRLLLVLMVTVSTLPVIAFRLNTSGTVPVYRH